VAEDAADDVVRCPVEQLVGDPYLGRVAWPLVEVGACRRSGHDLQGGHRQGGGEPLGEVGEQKPGVGGAGVLTGGDVSTQSPLSCACWGDLDARLTRQPLMVG